ncbi:hypothetical protein EVAR_25407_1 [Eumeta japonica]|uniref:Uncharacterized protein n=1 Tax=Eumeta variegata TaxID=151549 RepID=A0A4C1V602_EUMVA|nr:hypothetical protein EVAR_25407_1 [Eumeta japonica]
MGGTRCGPAPPPSPSYATVHFSLFTAVGGRPSPRLTQSLSNSAQIVVLHAVNLNSGRVPNSDFGHAFETSLIPVALSISTPSPFSILVATSTFHTDPSPTLNSSPRPYFGSDSTSGHGSDLDETKDKC